MNKRPKRTQQQSQAFRQRITDLVTQENTLSPIRDDELGAILGADRWLIRYHRQVADIPCPRKRRTRIDYATTKEHA